MSKRFGRKQKKKALAVKKEYEHLKGSYSEALELVQVMLDVLGEDDLEYVFSPVTSERSVKYGDKYISVDKLRTMFSVNSIST